ncbi:MAG: FkbM family methyltransferase [Candidatus Margulisiibacteriota bacterium]|jgi:FkbM family methyltransferase
MKKILFYVTKLIEKLFHKKLVFINKNSFSLNLGLTAVKSKFNFWYVGNVFDSADIAFGIVNNGLVEKEETELVEKIIKNLLPEKNITFYDIGANTGYYGILAACLDKQKITTYSFEPIMEFANCIKESAKINHLDNINIFNIALGNENITKEIQLAGSGSSLNPKFNDNEKLPKQKITVKKLDDIIKINNINHPDFIKIDVEGYEYEVLQGSLDTIKKSLPILFIEIAYSLKNLNRNFINQNYKKTFELLDSLGYRVYRLANNTLEPFKADNNPDGVHMYLFLHNNHQTILNNLLIK